MRRWLTVVVVGSALMAIPGLAQMRGARAGPHASHGPTSALHFQGFHSTAVSRPSSRGNFSPRFRSDLHSNFRSDLHSNFRSGFRHSFRHHEFDHRGFGIVWPFDYGYPSYYPSYPLFGNGYDSEDDEQNYGLQQQVPQMSDEVEQQMQSRSMAGPPPRPEPLNEATSVPSTTLVFRNGKTQQVQNYAILGQTLWVFNQQQEMKIPLSDLDLPATQTLNEEQGVSFQIPPAR